MDDRPIWTRDAIVRFSHHPDASVRGWAWGRLCRHHPEEAGRQAARGLADPEVPVALTALGAFEAHPTPQAAATLEALRRREGVAPALRAAIEGLGQPDRRKKVHDPEADEDERLANAPEELRRRAPAMLVGPDFSEYLRALAGLGHQQYGWATDILLAHFAVLLTAREDSEVWDALEDLSDPRSLPAIHAAWRPGQRRAACLYARIHDLAGLSGSLPEGIARDVADDTRSREESSAFRLAHPGAPLRGSRRLDVRCRACGRTGEYDTDPAGMREMVATKTRAGKTRRALDEEPVMVCKYCGAKNTYQLAPLSLIAALGGALGVEDEDEDEDEDNHGRGSPRR
jgi:hypothetical protein